MRRWSSDLVYDLGLHKGEDSEFYLKKGFRVVGVDANEEMCDLAARRLSSVAERDRFTVLNVAIADCARVVDFYRSEKTDWGTIEPTWNEQNHRRGRRSQSVPVQAVPLSAIIEEHGEPYFIKIDIEGMDRIALASLLETKARPKFISMESDYSRRLSSRLLRQEFAILEQLGYDRFKVVPQHHVPNQSPPNPPAEGAFVDHHFEFGSSGLFGEEAPGEWVGAADAMRIYESTLWHFRRYWARNAVNRLKGVGRLFPMTGIEPGWYDTHAKHSEA